MNPPVARRDPAPVMLTVPAYGCAFPAELAPRTTADSRIDAVLERKKES